MGKKITADQLASMNIDESTAKDLSSRINRFIEDIGPAECWQKVSKDILKPDDPFELHWFLYNRIYSDWDESKGPRPAWIADKQTVEESNIAGLVKDLGLGGYNELHAWSVQNRAQFWAKMTKKLGIKFQRSYSNIVDLSSSAASPKWFVDAKINIVDSCFNAPGDRSAIVYRKAGDKLSTMSYVELESLTNRVANGLMAVGFCHGDAIAIAMPMTAETVAIYLGIIKAGCVVVSIADSFAPPEIEKRLRLSNAKGIFTQDVVVYAGKEFAMYEKVKSANAPRSIVLSYGDYLSVELTDNDIGWQDFLSDDDQFESVPSDPGGHTNILFSSGTTGDPKAIPWTHTTPIKCAADGYLHHDIKPGGVVAWPTNLGWMMGPWLIYASLINKGTIALYYGASTGREFGEFVQDAKVNMLGLVPSLVRVWKNSGCIKGLDWSNIKTFSSTGECSNVEDMLFLMSLAGYKPIIEYCGGTEIGGGFITGTVVQNASPATFSTTSLGLDIVILDGNDQVVGNGELFLIPPSVGLSTELLNQDHYKVYFDKTPKGPDDQLLRRHGDQFERLVGGYFRGHGRVDDTMNLGGIKVSSTEIERVLNSIEGVNETAAIAVSAQGEGMSRLVVYTVLTLGTNIEKEMLQKTMQKTIKQNLNPLFKVHDVVLVDSLPRTASNKIMRRKLRSQYKL